jgi:predicted enzyme related to lactoylglutathione lyase
MPVRTSYPQGTPNWVDLQSPDQAGAKAFYAGLLGWTYDDMPMGPDAVYSMAKLGDGVVSAIAPQSPELAAAKAPAIWNTYIAVDNADEATERARAAGGTVAMEPFDIPQAGRMAFVLDPAGTPVALWQAGDHIGASVVNEPGAVIWNELLTADPSVHAFYEATAGMKAVPMDMEGQQYTCWEVDGRQVGGTMSPPMPGVPNHWHVYFAVADADAAAAKAVELGGQVLVEPFDTPVGRIAVLMDPQGANFSVLKSSGEPAA